MKGIGPIIRIISTVELAGDNPSHEDYPLEKILPGGNPRGLLGLGPRFWGRIGSGVRVGASFQVFVLKLLLSLPSWRSGNTLRCSAHGLSGLQIPEVRSSIPGPCSLSVYAGQLYKCIFRE